MLTHHARIRADIRARKMASIQDEKQYKAMMARVDELFFATDENTPENDVRLVELDHLSSLIEEYEKDYSSL